MVDFGDELELRATQQVRCRKLRKVAKKGKRTFGGLNGYSCGMSIST